MIQSSEYCKVVYAVEVSTEDSNYMANKSNYLIPITCQTEELEEIFIMCMTKGQEQAVEGESEPQEEAVMERDVVIEGKGSMDKQLKVKELLFSSRKNKQGYLSVNSSMLQLPNKYEEFNSVTERKEASVYIKPECEMLKKSSVLFGNDDKYLIKKEADSDMGRLALREQARDNQRLSSCRSGHEFFMEYNPEKPAEDFDCLSQSMVLLRQVDEGFSLLKEPERGGPIRSNSNDIGERRAGKSPEKQRATIGAYGPLSSGKKKLREEYIYNMGFREEYKRGAEVRRSAGQQSAGHGYWVSRSL